jgi:transposase-like protein
VSTCEGWRKRQRHSAEFKAKVVAACRQPGVSMAAVALAHDLNANLLRRWVVEAQQATRSALAATALGDRAAAPAFVSLPLPVPSSQSAEPICIELVRSGATIRVQWPLSAAAQCAAWLSELL